MLCIGMVFRIYYFTNASNDYKKNPLNDVDF